MVNESAASLPVQTQRGEVVLPISPRQRSVGPTVGLGDGAGVGTGVGAGADAHCVFACEVVHSVPGEDFHTRSLQHSPDFSAFPKPVIETSEGSVIGQPGVF